MSSAFSIALSALKAQSDAINTPGNNLANINTTGFKTSDVAFRDLVASNLGWSTSSGMGVSRPTTQQSFSQGTITSSDSPWSAAIQGNGFFVL
jgi:flagellar hook protein FlgE